MMKSRPQIHILTIRTTRRTELQDVTDKIESAIRESGCAFGMCHLYVPHTTAGVLINEGYDPDVARDMEGAFDRLVPDSPCFAMRKEIRIRTSRLCWSAHQKRSGSKMVDRRSASGNASSSRSLTARERANCASRSFRMPAHRVSRPLTSLCARFQ